MKMLKVVPVFAAPALALAATSVLADAEFGASVPREVVEQFVTDAFGGGPGKLYADIFDAFPSFAVPAGFTVLASADQGYLQRVILKTSVDEAAAKATLAAALRAEGWQEMPIYGGGAPQTGFVTAEAPPQPLSFCSDALGRMSVSVSAGAAPHYVSLSRSNVAAMGNGVQRTCAEEIEMITQGPAAMRGRMGPELSQYVPRLLMPESNTAEASPRVFMGSGGSSNDWETGASLVSEWSIDAVFEHFTSQVNAQGWTADSAVTGAAVATASWTKTVNDMDLVGLLTIINTAENTWQMKFRILRKSNAAPAANRRFTP